jgi:prevent-host-death family protein
MRGVRRASIAALKAHLSEYVDAAKAGEEIIVTDRNRPVARLGPVEVPMRRDARTADLVRAGLARPAARTLPRSFWRRPRPRDRRGRVLAALLEERAGGR